MAKHLVNQEEVKEALGISSFRNLSKDKVIEFVSLLPQMDKELALSIIQQFPSYVELATTMVEQLTKTCDSVLEKASVSQVASIEAYKLILNDLSLLLKKENITKEEQDKITDKMILVADKIAAKDTEGKSFMSEIVKYKEYVITGALVLGAVILGVTVSNKGIPKLNKS